MLQLNLLLKKSGLLMVVLTLLSTASFGATYTASATGQWSASATWAGGTVPPLNITGDQVIIPAGIVVTLDNNLAVNGALASLAVNGTLTSAASDTITLNTGAITGAGTLSPGTIILNAGSTLAFTGTLAVNTLINMSTGLQAVAHATISQALVLANTIAINTGGTLTMAANSTIVITGGALTTTGGVLTLTNNYNVTYLTSTAHAGLELTGSGLSTVTVNVPSTDSVYLTAATTVNGTLDMVSGTLSLNGQNLNLNGSLSGSGSATISSTGASSISIHMSSGPGTALTFSANGNTVNNFTLDMFTGADFALGSDMTVNGVLTLTSGHLDLQGTHALDIAASGSVSGGGSSSYVIATGTSYLGMHLTAGAGGFTTFHVGTTDYYAPASVQLNSGSASQDVDVSVGYGVKAQGTTGTNLALTEPSVNVTWFIEPDNAAQANANLKLGWSSAMEVNGFNRDSAYLSHFVGYWDQSAIMAAATVSGMYTIQRNNIGSFSPFAVFGKNATGTGINDVSADAYFEIYPNPVADRLIIRNTSQTEMLNADILNLTGQVVGSYKVNGANPDITLGGLEPGKYFVRLYGDKVNVVKSFSKL